MNKVVETESAGCSSSLTVIDVFNALQTGYAFISGTVGQLTIQRKRTCVDQSSTGFTWLAEIILNVIFQKNWNRKPVT